MTFCETVKEGILKKRVVIIAGARIRDLEWLRRELTAAGPATVLCADGGARYARLLGETPALIVGDMDSLKGKQRRFFAERGVPFAAYPVRKDETDTWLALERAIAMGAAEVTILGALGQRLDHTLANIGLLLLGSERGVRVTLRDEDCEIFTVNRRATVKGEKGQTVSLFALGGEARGVTLAGFEYPLTGAVMTPSRPYGVSNRLAASAGRIQVQEGCLLVIHYRSKAKTGEKSF